MRQAPSHAPWTGLALGLATVAALSAPARAANDTWVVASQAVPYATNTSTKNSISITHSLSYLPPTSTRGPRFEGAIVFNNSLTATYDVTGAMRCTSPAVPFTPVLNAVGYRGRVSGTCPRGTNGGAQAALHID